MDFDLLSGIIEEELTAAKERILERVGAEFYGQEGNGEEEQRLLPPLPANENYGKALELYRNKSSHSKVTRELGVSMGSAKRYYNWLVINGYLEAEPAELSEREREVVVRLFERGMSLSETARDLGVSIPNVTQRRNNALRKGYKPPGN